MNNYEFTVTRQKRYQDGLSVVEINQGNIDYANPGMLTSRYWREGEGDTFIGMGEAIKHGLAVARRWEKDNPETKIYIAIGNTHGMSLPLDEMELNQETEQLLTEKARIFDNQLPKCSHCGEFLGKERWYPQDYLIGEEEFVCCSENCATEERSEMDNIEEDEEE